MRTRTKRDSFGAEVTLEVRTRGMYRHILIGIDFSDASVESVRWAASRFPQAALTLFHAIEPLTLPAYVRRELGSDTDLLRERGLDAKANLEQLAEACGVEARLEVRRGWTPDTLAETAEELEAELIVVAAHRRRLSPNDELGATCVATVRRSSVPVLVWRPIRHEQDKTILAALDLREGGAPIAATAARYAAYFRTRLLLLHAMPPTIQALRTVSSHAKAEDLVRRLEQSARADALARVPHELRGELDIQVIIKRGRPVAKHILKTAVAEAADLIVIGKYHTPAFPARLLLGGITQAVIRGAICSVLTVPL